MSLWSWLTGRNPKEEDLYANFSKVAEVTDELRNVATKTVDKNFLIL